MVDFLVIGPRAVVFYKDIFPLIKDRNIVSGYNIIDYFDGCDKRVVCRWFNNINYDYPSLLLSSKKYIEGDYKIYDNTDVINIDRIDDIPYDYDGVMGVPVSFIDYWNPEQFELVGICNKGSWTLDKFRPIIDGLDKFSRILIKRKIS